MKSKVSHPAKYSDVIMSEIAGHLRAFGLLDTDDPWLYDPFAGTGKIAKLRDHGFAGKIFCGEIEPEWTGAFPGVDHWHIGDSAHTPFIADGFFEVVVTSPTYGNRMADHFRPRDKSRRINYRSSLGRDLSPDNTGRMQWGGQYRFKHLDIYKEVARVMSPHSYFILNISDHIRAGKRIPVAAWHIETLESFGLEVVHKTEVETPRMKMGENNTARIDHESVITFEKRNKFTVTSLGARPVWPGKWEAAEETVEIPIK